MRQTDMAPMEDDIKKRVAQWAADNPEGAAVLRAEGAAQERGTLKAQHDAALALAMADGARQERERVAAIRAVVPPGYDAVADQAIADGLSPDQAAHAVCVAVRTQTEHMARSNAEQSPAPVGFAAAASSQEERRISGILGPGSNEDQIHEAVLSYQAANPGVSYVDAFRSISQGVN